MKLASSGNARGFGSKELLELFSVDGGHRGLALMLSLDSLAHCGVVFLILFSVRQCSEIWILDFTRPRVVGGCSVCYGNSFILEADGTGQNGRGLFTIGRTRNEGKALQYTEQSECEQHFQPTTQESCLVKLELVQPWRLTPGDLLV